MSMEKISSHEKCDSQTSYVARIQTRDMEFLKKMKTNIAGDMVKINK